MSAEYGEAIIIRTMAEGKPFTIVVDGGPESTADSIVNSLQEVGHIDMMILTHFDEDHIFGLIRYVEQFKGKVLPVDTFWCNCAQEIDLAPDSKISDAGYGNANTLARYLREQSKVKPDFIWTQDITVAMTQFVKGDLKIQVLSPTIDILNELKDGYNEYVREHAWIDSEESTDIALVGLNPDAKRTIDDLVKKDNPRTVNLWNKASIAFLLNAEGKQVLMLGDADADIVAESIENRYGKDAVLDIDLVKLSHHGSKHNISKRLLSHIKCNDYAVCTNGGAINFCHPDRKMLALVVRNEKRAPGELRFCFNYPIDKIQERTEVLMTEDEQLHEGCRLIEKKVIRL